ncbi:MAG: hypothetical protein RIQ71_1566 [Verrucomicrobiota bacterium]|jgi:pimeloyl-ACP methyl ester carboxylesterase
MSRRALGILGIAATLIAPLAEALPPVGRSEPPGITEPDLDSDGDGLSNQEEAEILGANPNNPDTDGDGLADGSEAFPTSAILKYPRQPSTSAFAVIDLGPATQEAYVVDLNNNNQVLDSSGRIWAQGAWGEPLFSGAMRINDSGNVLAYRSSGPIQKYYPERLNPDTGEYGVYGLEAHWWVYLNNTPLYSGYDNDDEDSLQDNYGSWGASLNNSGQVVGMTAIGIGYGGEKLRAFRWQGQSMEILPGFGVTPWDETIENQPMFINDNGTIAGLALTESLVTGYEGYLDQAGQRTLLGTFTPCSLNNSNHVLLSPFENPASGANLHVPGAGTQDLVPILGKGVSASYAQHSLNNRGELLLYHSGRVVVANNSRLVPVAPPDWSISPVAFNDSGLIAGTGTSPSEQWKNVLLVPVDMAVDANRDGLIKFSGNANDQSVFGKPFDRTSEDRPSRHWVNADYDGLPNSEGEFLGTGTEDHEDGVIQTARDLEDFFRIWLHVGALHEQIAAGTFKIGLKWANTTDTPKIKVYRSTDPDGSDEYLKNEEAAFAQVSGDNAETLGEVAGSSALILPVELWADFSAQNPKVCLLFEGSREGKGQLMLTIHKADGTEIGEGSGVWLDLLDVRKMYTSSVDNMLTGTPPGEAQQTLVFVHGWNMSPDGSRNYAETMFKRLWHRGYKGRFAYFRWNTDWSDAFDNVPVVGEAAEAYFADYNDSEYTGWTAGAPTLKTFVQSLPYQNKNIAAHSMGNIVVSEAMRQGMQINNYALMQPAVPAACYDERAVIEQTQTATHAVEMGLWDGGPSYTTTVTVWNRPTPDDDSDQATRNLAYRGALKNIGQNGNLILFYLPNDNATSYAWELNNAVTKPPGQMSGIFRYARNNPSGEKLFKDYGGGTHVPFLGAQRHEAMSYACRTWGKAAGAEQQTQGAISAANRVNLGSAPFQLPGEDTNSGFGDEHSGQFKANIQSLKPFHDALMDELQLPRNP